MSFLIAAVYTKTLTDKAFIFGANQPILGHFSPLYDNDSVFAK
jgi:hypothetical protein